jgi:hypothetical protein
MYKIDQAVYVVTRWHKDKAKMLRWILTLGFYGQVKIECDPIKSQIAN